MGLLDLIVGLAKDKIEGNLKLISKLYMDLIPIYTDIEHWEEGYSEKDFVIMALENVGSTVVMLDNLLRDDNVVYFTNREYLYKIYKQMFDIDKYFQDNPENITAITEKELALCIQDIKNLYLDSEQKLTSYSIL